MNARMAIMSATQTRTASILLVHTAASVSLVTKGADSFVNVSVVSCLHVVNRL